MVRLTHRALLLVVGALTFGALVGMAVLWPDARPEPAPQSSELVDATLVEVTELPSADVEGLLPGAVELLLQARIDATGEYVTFEMSDETGVGYKAGQEVRLAAIEQPDGTTTYLISDFRRDGPLRWLVVLFLGAVLAFGRWQGLRALVGLALSFVVILAFIVPAILDGQPPAAVAIVGSILIMTLTLYLSHGASPKTSSAVVGTGLALLLTGALAAIFVSAANITGFASEEARLANYSVGGLSLRGLLLAGILLGGLGVLDDVTISQASTVFELHRANPALRFPALVASALRVGRDHIAATVNTLFLAYAGASLPLLLLFLTGPDALGTIATSEVVAVEIVRTLVGSIGLIAAVPFTTALAAALVAGRPRRAHRE